MERKHNHKAPARGLALGKLIGGFPMTPPGAPGTEVQIRFQFPTSAVLYGAKGVGGPLLGPSIAA